jgi:hypothetical protein
MSNVELRQTCRDLRHQTLSVSDHLIEALEATVPQGAPGSEAPAGQQLSLIGWLIYEASLSVLREAAPARIPGEAEGARPEDRIQRLADLARALPAPHLAPRALGAIRAAALMKSKLDTESAYDEAWALHREVRLYLDMFEEALGGHPPHDPLRLQLLEVKQQSLLAETGTACRSAEHVICRWEEGAASGKWGLADEYRWMQRLFLDLVNGLESGKQARALTSGIHADFGLVDEADEHRLLVHTAYRQPSIMTARAALLMLAMCPELESLGVAPTNRTSWRTQRESLIDDFRQAYGTAATSGDGAGLPIEHRRSLVQLRLMFALIAPGREAGPEPGLDQLIGPGEPRDSEVDRLSLWLRGPAEQNARHDSARYDAGVIGSATMPAFIRSIEACRSSFGAAEGYRQWRSAWPMLDRYHPEPDRPDRVAASLRQP